MLASILLLIGTLSTPQPLNAIRIQDGPSIDGVLDDAVWSQAETVCCRLMQYGPEYGSEMTEETEISILYNDSHIYFSFSMNDPDPNTMLNGLTPRDNYVTGEWIAILLDTWGDGREATSFEISLANSQMDSKVNPYGGWDYSWDAVWESGTMVTDEGWTAEFAIPFSCLRFDQTSDVQSWTVNFQRILGKTRENGWYVLSEGGPMADLETFADLNGVESIEGSLGLEIRPYFSERSIHDSETDEWDNTFDAGVDIKLGIGSSIAADFTVNPDFGQIEADAVEMNLSHFELFLQEKRPFFLESQNVFRMPFMMFYSRRIGAVAPNGDVIPIIGGGKISGSLGGGFRFGFLDAVTAAVSEGDLMLVPATNYGIFRTVRDFGTYSYIGISAVSRESWKQDEFDADHNTALALDGAFEIPGNHLVSLAAAQSW
ncbi:MAG: carbohydrate binding family 9 domain-containing protein, partial [Candidatus Aegiribacteria sp.]|nr:carbohydrate binding family 9 domain-containing protein [Candidatus Aegiribacteria sp.]